MKHFEMSNRFTTIEQTTKLTANSLAKLQTEYGIPYVMVSIERRSNMFGTGCVLTIDLGEDVSVENVMNNMVSSKRLNHWWKHCYEYDTGMIRLYGNNLAGILGQFPEVHNWLHSCSGTQVVRVDRDTYHLLGDFNSTFVYMLLMLRSRDTHAAGIQAYYDSSEYDPKEIEAHRLEANRFLAAGVYTDDVLEVLGVKENR